jgi:hypothetical protein
VVQITQKPNDPRAGDIDQMVARAREQQRSDPRSTVSGTDVRGLAGALRAARRAHAAYVTELRQADVDPPEDWSTWYAEYLLGVR